MATRSRASKNVPIAMILGALSCLAPKFAYSQAAATTTTGPTPSGQQSTAMPSATVPTTSPPNTSAPAQAAPAPSSADVPSNGAASSNVTTTTPTPTGNSSSPTAAFPTQTGATAVAQPAATPAEAVPNAAPPSCKQEPMRDGLYLRMITGIGYARLSGTGTYGSSSISGLGGHQTLAIGGGIIRGLALAGTMQATTTSAKFKHGPFDDAQVTSHGTTVSGTKLASGVQAQLGALVDWYPDPLSGFHVGLSAGVGTVAVTHQATDTSWGGMATSGTLLAGYDFALSRSWGIGAVLVATGTTSTELKDSDNKSTGYKLGGFAIEFGSSLLYF